MSVRRTSESRRAIANRWKGSIVYLHAVSMQSLDGGDTSLNPGFMSICTRRFLTMSRTCKNKHQSFSESGWKTRKKAMHSLGHRSKPVIAIQCLIARAAHPATLLSTPVLYSKRGAIFFSRFWSLKRRTRHVIRYIMLYALAISILLCFWTLLIKCIFVVWPQITMNNQFSHRLRMWRLSFSVVRKLGHNFKP